MASAKTIPSRSDIADQYKWNAEAVFPSLRVKTKKQALQDLAEKAARLTGIGARDIFETLLQRERLGSTGVGRGIAIPHGRVPQLTKIVSVFARLPEPIDFDALDEEPVDLIFLLLAPEHAGADHLKALARISRLLREPSTIEKLRGSHDRAALYAVLTEPAASHAA
jgi:PTS system nitrogen regulatory IIA component